MLRKPLIRNTWTIFKVVKLVVNNKDNLLEPIPYDEKIMNTQFYDKVTEHMTLEYPTSCVQYQHD